MTNEEFQSKKSELTAPFKQLRWRVQAKYPKGPHPTYCIILPYIDARMVQQRLDDVLGAENWQNTYDAESGSSSLSVLINGEWVTKTDVGEDTKVEKVKGKASDAFKRAAVLWGIGRDLYTIGEKSLNLNEYGVPVSFDKKLKLDTPTALSNYMNKISESEGLLYQIYKLNPNLRQDDEFIDCLKRLKEYVKLQ